MGRLRTVGFRLPAADTRKVKTEAKRGDPFYDSAPWRALVARLIQERGRVCQSCGAQGVCLHGDHIVELQDGGAALEPSNVQLLCLPCHNKKTAKARTRRLSLRPDQR